jgi:hypothetical protein
VSTVVFAERGIDVTSKSNRIALVIGNANYQSAPLKNPVNDANDMVSVLKQKGFTVTLLTDATQRQMEKAIGAFGKQLRSGGVGLFFYAGHGMQVNGVNYLIPIGANIEAESDIKYESVNANRVLSKMEEGGNDLNMVFLDACRNNPFTRSFRSSNKGLAQMDAPKGSFVSFATAPGSIAADGTGRNGLFTGQLIQQMQVPELPLTKMMMEVRKDVLRESQNKQTPWDVSSLTGDFYFTQGSEINKNRSNSEPINSFEQNKGQIEIITQPTKAKIYINNILEGESPLTVSLDPGIYTIEAKKKDYISIKETARIRDNKTTKIHFLFEKTTKMTDALPEKENKNSNEVNGIVITSDGKPVWGVGIAFTSKGVRLDVMSDEQGRFKVILPFKGKWLYGNNSVRADARCIVYNTETSSLKDYVDNYGWSAELQVPAKDEIVILFEKAYKKLIGTIKFRNGKIAKNKSIAARRKDGAYSWGSSNNKGWFEIPITIGDWEVFARDFTNNRNSIKKHIKVTGSKETWTIHIDDL